MPEFENPAMLAINLIRYIGDRISETGEPIAQMSEFSGEIGAPSNPIADEIFMELLDKGIVRVKNYVEKYGGTIFLNVNLSLEGWKDYELEKRGVMSGNQGFIAMKFNDPELDSFVNDTVKPATKEIGYDLVDMRDVARAGVIDNIMRAQIRDAAFVIVDLTHDNSGAYWEAGYAEGLGKPVIYICERTKFEEASTHFDTNHCTTVPWSSDDPDGFRRELIATLRRSLDLN